VTEVSVAAESFALFPSERMEQRIHKKENEDKDRGRK
jgi:hypothetical protein